MYVIRNNYSEDYLQNLQKIVYEKFGDEIDNFGKYGAWDDFVLMAKIAIYLGIGLGIVYILFKWLPPIIRGVKKTRASLK